MDKRRRLENKIKIRSMSWVLAATAIVTLAKFVAYFITHSNAILTDALESIINILAGSFGLFSIMYASKPKDENHPYGHGKMEFVSVGFEGGLILFAGAAVIAKAAYNFFAPYEIEKLDIGLYIIAIAGLINYLLGKFLIRRGTKFNSQTLQADGQHLIIDTWSSIALIAGLSIIYFTKLHWLDSVLAILLGGYILKNGYKLILDSLAGLTDEIDLKVVEKITEALNKNRKPEWIDIHNLRVVRYGSSIHVDAHLTLPWYYDLKTSHGCVKQLEQIVNSQFRNGVEFFIHTDPCLPVSCPVCNVNNCTVRQAPFIQSIKWKAENLLRDQMHGL